MRSALVLTCAAAASCGGGASRDPVAEAVRAGLAAQLGVTVDRVRCGREACEARLAGGARVQVRLQGDRELVWESEDVVLTGALAVRVRAELAALGVEAAVDCGPPRVAAPGERLACELTGGGMAWATLSPDGGVDVEVALTPAAVRARTEPVDAESLDVRSRALDTDEAQGVAGDPASDAEDDDDGDQPVPDAGPGPAPR